MTTAGRRFSLDEISDRLEIQDLVLRYATAIDTHEWALLDEVFVPEAECDYTESGGIAGPWREVRPWLEKVVPSLKEKLHLVGPPYLRFEGERAFGRTSLYNPNIIPMPDGSKRSLVVGGWYEDEFVRTPEGWRIARRVERQSVCEDRRELPRA